jgi:thioredoxin reductase/Fe-S-cluster-containing hydrogenase component 2/bacterioferritin-associated ferredoxin
MKTKRITQHPILEIPKRKEVAFTWNGETLKGYVGETIASALIANDIHIFGHHAKDNSPQGMFCANGQCSQCLVVANGLSVKSCMTPLEAGMAVESLEGLPSLPEDDTLPPLREAPVREVEVLIIGGGPAGLSAAIELGRLGVDTLIADDKGSLGGKLLLQTHKFFGSVEDSYAGTRGFEIAQILEEKGEIYRKIRPLKILVATGAREKMLSFPGNTLPGIYGAGAFQTLVNRDLVRSSDRVLIVGGGNVGLIAGYHAIQAGIDVVALIEALPHVGGYKVHADKLQRLGVPIYTSHTVVSAMGKERVESVTIAQLDKDWNVIPGTHKTFHVDTVLIAVGLAEINEFYSKAKEWGMDVYAAGDAQEIAEASSAMFTGKMTGLKIAGSLGLYEGEIPEEWEEKETILKSKPGPLMQTKKPREEEGIMPIFHCRQEVPCNPCVTACPEGAIKTERDEITGLPYIIDVSLCKGCLNCVFVCPGLATTLVDYRKDEKQPIVTLPYEIWREKVEVGEKVAVTDVDGAILGYYPVEKVLSSQKKYPGTLLVQVRVEKDVAKEAVGIWVQEEQVEPSLIYEKELPPDEAIICRCERITAGEVRSAIREGVRDINQLKAITRAGMGACGSKTCRPMIWRLFEEEGIDLTEVTDRTDRPLYVEVPLGILAGVRGGGEG